MSAVESCGGPGRDGLSGGGGGDGGSVHYLSGIKLKNAPNVESDTGDIVLRRANGDEVLRVTGPDGRVVHRQRTAIATSSALYRAFRQWLVLSTASADGDGCSFDGQIVTVGTIASGRRLGPKDAFVITPGSGGHGDPPGRDGCIRLSVNVILDLTPTSCSYDSREVLRFETDGTYVHGQMSANGSGIVAALREFLATAGLLSEERA